jgi:hypothetical protein
MSEGHPNWQLLDDLYKYVERPLTIVRIADDVFHDVMANYPAVKTFQYQVWGDICALVQAEIATDARALAVFILALFRELPETNPARFKRNTTTNAPRST